MVADVRAASETLRELGFAEDEVERIECGPDRRPLLEALARIDRTVSDWPSGSMFFYFSGHGILRGETLATAVPAILFEDDELPWDDVLATLARWEKVRITLLADC